MADIQHKIRKNNPRAVLAFVPTMGALHEGHIRLIREARSKSDVVVCSVFVNPTQFNDPKDLDRYPRTIDADIRLLAQNNCDYVFIPSVEEVYPEGTDVPYEIDFNGLDLVMEGVFRPGHFKGVAMVVERLFDLVKPDVAFFGRKDFQQVSIIRRMVDVRHLPVKIAWVETARSKEGLALSSRNVLLSDSQKEEALIIYHTLLKAREWSQEEKDVPTLKNRLVDYFKTGTLDLEYLEIVDDRTLMPVDSIRPGCTCCITAFCGRVRLIDNIQLA